MGSYLPLSYRQTTDTEDHRWQMLTSRASREAKLEVSTKTGGGHWSHRKLRDEERGWSPRKLGVVIGHIENWGWSPRKLRDEEQAPSQGGVSVDCSSPCRRGDVRCLGHKSVLSNGHPLYDRDGERTTCTSRVPLDIAQDCRRRNRVWHQQWSVKDFKISDQPNAK